MQAPLKPLFSVETKCFVGLLNTALWTLNFKQELGSEESQWMEEMEESPGDPRVTLGESLQCCTSQLVWFVWWDIYTYYLVKMEPEFILILCSRTWEGCVCVRAAHETLPAVVSCLGSWAWPLGGSAGCLVWSYPDVHLCYLLLSLSPPLSYFWKLQE